MATTGYKLTRADLSADELLPVVRRFNDGKGQDYDPVYPKCMRVERPDGPWFEEMVLGGVDMIPKIDEGDVINTHTWAFGGKTRFIMDTRQAAFAITREDKRDNRIDKINKVLAARRDAVEATKEIVAAVPWNNAFSTSFLIWDGKPIFAGAGNAASTTAHSLVTPNISTRATTQDNTLPTAADMTVESVRDSYILLMTMVAHTGIPTNLMQGLFINCHPSEALNAEEILQSANLYSTVSGRPDTSYPGVKNVLTNKGIGVVANPFYHDTDAWGLFSLVGKNNFVAVMDGKPVDETWEDHFTRSTWYSEEFRMIAGCADFTGMVGTPGVA